LKKPGNGIYAFVLKGDFTIGNIALNERDGLGIWDTEKISIIANSTDAEILLMEVPMKL
jgi:redox-sensitive bicupin YhaK (pirin superfamily)